MAILKLSLFFSVVLLSACATGRVVPVGSPHYLPGAEGDEQELLERVERFAQEIERKGLVYDDPALTAYVNKVGKKVVPTTAQKQMSFRFFIYRDPRPNAFALHSGRIYIHTGLISAMDSEDQLAYVLAHEAVHVINRHLLREVRSKKTKTVAAEIALIAGEKVQEDLESWLFSPERGLGGVPQLEKQPLSLKYKGKLFNLETALAQGSGVDFLHTVWFHHK